ncbi:unnamed protein product [Zymoseptoria tritici ST99CH_1A5]|uniref:TFIIS N-terminal domain-containing protein n=3 Tax=Zymoseptoria tritici TaxID=1047171 RepID=A0A1X7RLD3_ZYMT9|nr:unnamed protein product [Zymoseptoria tritici ST99CH_3D7]SMR46330.1 unnamed protein product [Zymoseptoria tritici ST99CH_1E4]SMR47579.1 unnamed protein product [Zymoseptoria tritici ST99CH_3D1]SMY21482.1 unnamed protein product [Zymoseptoria tritici ST99CH_1A5]
MEDLEMPAGSPAVQNGNEPQGNDDPGDMLRPGVEEEDNSGTPPIAEPEADMEMREADDAPVNGNAELDPTITDAAVQDDEDGDLESDLEELDEEQFDDFDPSALNIPDKPLMVDETNVGLLGVHKRKRTAEEEAERERKKKKKEKKRDRPSKRSKKSADDEDDFEGGVEMDGKRARNTGEGRPGKAAKRARTPEDEENLSPEERRRRALDRKMDEALKSHTRVSRRKQGQDMEERADQELGQMRERIGKACEADAKAREAGGMATQKLKILPDLVELLNRNTIQAQLVDPDVNILEGVRWMLEPADQDAALPNYKIQRELFNILSRLNIGKEALKASQIGKVVLFYTKSTQPQPAIKQMAQRLVGEWMRIILNKTKDHRNVNIETREYDPVLAEQSQRAAGTQIDRSAIAAEKRRKILAAPGPTNRARVEGGLGTYTIAPVSNLSNAQGVSSRTLGSSGADAFRKIAARSQGGKGGRR